MSEKNIVSMIEESCDLPPVPLVASKVLKLVKDPDSTVRQMEEVISSDSNMVSKILGIANSAYYVRMHKVKTLKAAINVLGYKALANLVIAASTRQFFPNFGLVEKLLWEHSVGTAIAATVLAKEFRIIRSDEALVGGLLHDIGKTIMNFSKPGEYRTVSEHVYNENISYFDVEQEVFGFNHSDVGSYLVQKWNFPIELGKLIYYHHRMDEIDISEIDPYQAKFIALGNFANGCTHCLGIGYKSRRESTEIGTLPSLKILGLQLRKEEDIDPLLEKISGAIEEEKGKFD